AVRALQVEDDGDRILELVGDLLRVVEAPRDDEVHAYRRRPRHCGYAGPQDLRPLGRRLGVGPVVELALPSAWRQPADVRPLRIGALEVLIGDVAPLVPILLLADAEVDPRPVPDAREAH